MRARSALERRLPVSRRARKRLASDPAQCLWRQFQELVFAEGPATVLEVGSRARSGNTYRDWLPDGCGYVGFDVQAGPNVDLVGDAHELSKHVPANSMGAGWSISTFEHLAMPWLVAVELSKVLAPGALFYVQSHQTWPVHDAPWDFWRFSSYAWRTLFHVGSGFEVVAAEMGEPARVRARAQHPPTYGLEDAPSYLNSAAIVRKTGDSTLRWDVDVTQILAGTAYPTGEIRPR